MVLKNSTITSAYIKLISKINYVIPGFLIYYMWINIRESCVRLKKLHESLFIIYLPLPHPRSTYCSLWRASEKQFSSHPSSVTSLTSIYIPIWYDSLPLFHLFELHVLYIKGFVQKITTSTTSVPTTWRLTP